MDKENNPAPENDSGDKGQEEKPTTFTQEQVNDIVSNVLPKPILVRLAAAVHIIICNHKLQSHVETNSIACM